MDSSNLAQEGRTNLMVCQASTWVHLGLNFCLCL